ncbi:chloride channel protein [Endozoicomonas ascidiicola]|uniref:chloride channel protein n=1 Tax=Endozoicomonas ascidiicola TaxID=1698521 RepID=UPI000B31D1E1|nr:chloride channel protein [Endozoicomonas ascidiicola]
MPTKPSIHKLRMRLAQSEALPQLTLIALFTGLLAGGLLAIFEQMLYLAGAFSQRSLIPEQIFSTVSSVESGYESLPTHLRFFAPIAGAVLLSLLIKLCPRDQRSFGIAHVIERLTLNRGWLPIRNTIIQFFGAFIALISGFSVGREGPAVHIGAGVGSYIGQILRLPANTLGVLAGCGAAAAIAALFNTPMAGVIFAMEVVMKEYTLESFIPIMASAVMASVVTQTVYGSTTAFQIPVIPLASMEELLLTVITALFIGLLAALFIRVNLFAIKKKQKRLTIPLLCAGLLMGIMGVLIPATMGVGYDTIQSLLHGETFTISFLVILLLAKLVITAVVVGLGVPGGVIGPSLMMGATTGACMTMIASLFFNISTAQITFHTVTGMIAMMAAVLQAPLAALVTVLEMTQSSEIILPAMLSIVIACLTSSQLCGQQGIFAMQFQVKGLNIRVSPMAQLLNRVGVASLMVDNRSSDVLSNPPAHSIDIQSTAHEALKMMDDYKVNQLLVIKQKAEDKTKPCGVITRKSIRQLL